MDIKCYSSNENKHYQESILTFQKNQNIEMNVIKVYPTELEQEMIGFGGAFTEAAASVLSTMAEDTKKVFLEAYFGENGNRYNFCRTHIQSCDFSLGNYAYVEDPNDTELHSFSIERDVKYLIPMIKEAQKLNPDMEFLASPWSPPAFMKSNQEMNHGGVLKPEYYSRWANMIVKYIKEYQAHGIEIHRLTVQNEPNATQTWDSCVFTAIEEGNFATKFLRKALDEQGLSEVKIAIWDHNKDCILERVNETFTVEESKEAIDGIAFHWYTGDHFEQLRAVHNKFPEKELIFTEGCVEYSRFKGNNQVENAEMYLHDIIGNINAGTCGYIDWNLLLDVEGGPNHVGNYCDAPIMYDKTTDQLDIKLTYYYIGHLSRYVKKGARKMLVSSYTDKIETVGFLNPDGSKVLVLLNRCDEDKVAVISECGYTCELNVGAHHIMTLCW